MLDHFETEFKKRLTLHVKFEKAARKFSFLFLTTHLSFLIAYTLELQFYMDYFDV